ncbi:hypothetical protein QCA50_004039 [Cerrena zonata]|uniref:Restriction of telomere capping protein 4 C-terminal domain-containing protein n=1 Tax=Cerrena zonata TaxID=2478898 RepID=A0AAW0GKU2_9APHY
MESFNLLLITSTYPSQLSVMPNAQSETRTPPPGKPVLFLPNRLHISSARKISREDFPLSSDQSLVLPFPDPLRRPGLGYPELRCKPMHRALISTQDDQTTQSAYRVRNLNPQKLLVNIRRCKTLWSNLKEYACDGMDLGPNADPRLFREDADQRFYSTWNANGTLPIAPEEQQLDAIFGLSAWFNMVADRKEAVVNCEEAVQDEVMIQILQPTNLLAQTRYPNSVGCPLDSKECETTRPKEPPSTKCKKKSADKTSGDIPTTALMPLWSRSTYAQHVDARIKKIRKAKGGLAGFPDFLWTGSLRGGDYGGIGEGKPYWGVTDEALRALFTTEYIRGPDGKIAWLDNSIIGTVVRQIWTELEWFASRWGFLTNGSTIIIFAKPHYDSQELIFSEFQDWDQDDVHLAMAGLTFATQDTKDIEKNLVDLHGDNEDVSLVDILCPLSQRDTDFGEVQEPIEQSNWTQKKSTAPLRRGTRKTANYSTRAVTFDVEQDQSEEEDDDEDEGEDEGEDEDEDEDESEAEAEQEQEQEESDGDEDTGSGDHN